MGSSPTIFTGASRFSADLKQVLTRAVGIASLPLSQLNNQLNALNRQGSELSRLDSKFSALQTALQNLSSGFTATSASVSDPSVVTVQSDAAALSASYLIHVTDPGSPTVKLSSASLPKVTDPTTQSISPSTLLTLNVNGTPVSVPPAATTLNALAQAINASGANVTASIVNIGSPGAPDYRLVVQSTGLGDIDIQLNDGNQDLLSDLTTGSEAQYQVNGLPSSPISSNSRSVTISPGLTATLLHAGDATVTVAQDPSAATNAVSSFVAAYNAAVDEIGVNRGQNGGALTGNSLVFTLAQSLRGLAGFTGGAGDVQNISDLGLTFDRNGHLNFDSAIFSTAVTAHPNDVAAFLGSADGGGFLKAASDTLDRLEDPINGLLTSAISSNDSRVTAQTNQISDEQDRIDLLQATLFKQVAAADALIASLEQQVTYFTSLFGAASGNHS